jgi:hypothetical protein
MPVIQRCVLCDASLVIRAASSLVMRREDRGMVVIVPGREGATVGMVAVGAEIQYGIWSGHV